MRVGNVPGFCTELRFHVVELTCRLNYSLLITIILLILLNNFYTSSLACLSLCISNSCPSILLSIHHPSACLNIIYLSIFLFIYLPIYIYNYLFVYLSIYLSIIDLFISQLSIIKLFIPIFLSVHIPDYLCIYLSVWMSVSLYCCIYVYLNLYQNEYAEQRFNFSFLCYKIRCTSIAYSKGKL